MNKKILLILVAIVAVLVVGGAYVAAHSGSQATSSAAVKVYRVGVLDALDYFTPTIDGFKQKMTELGYVEGKNIVYDIEKAPTPTGNQAIIQKFVDTKVDLILSFPTEASLEAKAGTQGTNIPVIFAEAGVEGTGLVDNVQKPGANLTGVRFPIGETSAKRLELLHILVPKATKIWIPVLKDYPTVAVGMDAIRDRAKELHLTLTEAPFTSPDDLAAYLKAHQTAPGMDAVLTIPEPVSITPAFMDQIYAFADAHKIPVAGANILDTDKGPIFSLLPDPFTFGTLAAPIAEKIFKGTPPGSIPVATPEAVFGVNMKALSRLGLTISEGLLSTANKVVH